LVLVPLLYLLPFIMNAQDNTREFRLAMVQMYVEPGALEKNLSHASDLIAEAAKNGADVVLLPEVLDLGWTHPSARQLAGSVPGGKACTAICNSARNNNVYVCCGVVEREGARVFNSALIIDSKGNVLIKHRKLNELDIAHDVYDQGDRLNVCTTPWGTFGLMICADANAKDHVLTRSLCYMGADVILSPSSWAVPPDHDNATDPYGDTWRKAYMPVAREFQVWIASASNVGPVTEGPWKNWNCIGCSLLVGPDGKEKLMGPYGKKAETILYYNIKPVPRPARGTGWSDR
jgi:predicted amidohydrolase